jgi:hypothetical protein
LRPAAQAVACVQARMQSQGLFTRNEVKLWFEEFDAALGSINARKAADALLKQLAAARAIALMSMHRGYTWHDAPLSTPEQ